MEFFRKDLLEKKGWRILNKLLQSGSRRMLDRFGPKGCNALAKVALLSIFIWGAVGGAMIALAQQNGTTALAISFSLSFGGGMLVVLGVLIMAIGAPNCSIHRK